MPDKPAFIQKSDIAYGAAVFRRLLEAQLGVGVFGFSDLSIAQRQAGANMSVDVLAGEGAVAFTIPEGDVYHARQATRVNSGTPGAPNTADGWVSTFLTADPSNPRLDAVVAQVRDSNLDAGGAYDLAFKVVAGAATAGATLDNRNGAAALPNNCLHLADVLVPASATQIVTADIRDRRPFALPGAIPPLLTDVDLVQLIPHPSLTLREDSTVQHTVHDLQQVAALFYLPRRIVGATRLRWKYVQDSTTALTGNYNIGIYDASGRKIVETGSVAFAGATSTFQVRSETIGATTFEAGWYYVVLGVDTAAGLNRYLGAFLRTDVALNTIGSICPNTGLRLATGGTTLPSTLLGFTDVNGLTTATNVPAVPVAALSVG